MQFDHVRSSGFTTGYSKEVTNGEGRWTWFILIFSGFHMGTILRRTLASWICYTGIMVWIMERTSPGAIGSITAPRRADEMVCI